MFTDLRPGDIVQVVDLWVESWHGVIPGIDFESKRNWLASHLGELAAKGAQVRVLWREKAPRGFVTIDPDNGYIDQLAVARAEWGSDAGGRLLAEARRMSPARLELLVNNDNPRAVRFYQKHGFEEAGEEISPVSGLPLLRMVWLAA